MAKLSIILLLSSLFITLLPLAHSQPKVTQLRVFLHDTFSGKNETVYDVAESNITSTSPTLFGTVSVLDDPLTAGLNPDSDILGRAQGIIAYADLNEEALHISLTFVFTSGEYNGSTLTVVGRNNVSQKTRQIPIVGGTGAFQLAQGIVTTSTDYSDPVNSISEFNFTIIQMFHEIKIMYL